MEVHVIVENNKNLQGPWNARNRLNSIPIKILITYFYIKFRIPNFIVWLPDDVCEFYYEWNNGRKYNND